MKKIKNALVLSALILGVGLTSAACGSSTPDTPKFDFITESNKTIDLTLPSAQVKTSDSSKYFGVYIGNIDSEGKFDSLSNGGDTLLVSGQTAKLYAYDAPTGYSLGANVTTDLGENTTELTISPDGTITAPNVEEKTTYVVELYAESNNSPLFDANGNPAKRVLKTKVNVDVIPASQFAKSSVESFTVELNEKTRAEVTGQLEQYAIKNGLTGISLSDNGGYSLYNDRVKSPLLDNDSYIPGYGFGTFQYGQLTKALKGETSEKYKMFYHSQIDPSSDKNTLNYLDSDNADVSDMYSYVSSSYFTTYLNKDLKSYSYMGNLARVDKPIPLNKDENTQLATKWKVPVYVGGDQDTETAKKGLTFRSGSKDSKYSAFDNKKVTLSDYLTPFKLLATGSVGWYRGTEQAGEDTANRQIKGFAEYFKSSKQATSLASDEEFSKKVGVSLDYSDNSVIIEFNAGFSEEFAIYQIDSLWSNPLNEEFIKTLGDGDVIKGAKIYGTAPTGLSPLDTTLSVGPYYCETYTQGQYIAFAKNKDWFLKKDKLNRDLYQIEGYHIKPNSALQNDKMALVTAWENEYIETCSVIDEVWEKYENDPRRKKVLGDMQQKFTFNRMDKLLWDEYFGEGGLWQQAHSPEGSSNWDVKPIASNDLFFYGLNLGVDRLGFAESFHRNPSTDYQNPIAKVNPVTGTLYNNTPEHKAALESVYGNAFDDLSTTPDLAVTYFRTAIEEELEAGHYQLGTGNNPTKVTLEIGSINDVYYRDRIAVIAQDWSNEFNKAVTTYKDKNGKNPLLDGQKPRIVFELAQTYVPSETSVVDLIQKGIWVGKFDIQFGYLINGNPYDTINNMNILMSNKMGGFELNFAVDTSIPSGDIYFDNKYWSFNSLWAACNGGTVIGSDGVEIEDVIGLEQITGSTIAQDGNSATLKLKVSQLAEGLTGKVNEVTPAFLNSELRDYVNAKSIKVEGDIITIVVPKEAFIDGKNVGAEGKTFFQGYITYTVTGENGKVATKEAVCEVLI